MLDLTENGLPNIIEINGRPYSIFTDYRVWLRFEISLSESTGAEGVEVGYIFKNDRPPVCKVQDLLTFARPPRELPRKVRGTSDAIAIDYKQDADLIYAAFLQQYGIDLIDIKHLHWHKFIALLGGLKGTRLDDIIGYRCYEKQTDKRIDPYEELREAWRIEKPLTAEELKELEDFNRLFGG